MARQLFKHRCASGALHARPTRVVHVQAPRARTLSARGAGYNAGTYLLCNVGGHDEALSFRVCLPDRTVTVMSRMPTDDADRPMTHRASFAADFSPECTVHPHLRELMCNQGHAVRQQSGASPASRGPRRPRRRW